MARTITLKDGDLLAKVAAREGFVVDTVWNDDDNAGLRAERDKPYLTEAGDVVTIPARRIKSETRATGKRHCFRLLTVPLPNYISFVFRDGLGGAVKRPCILEHPDGTLEDVVPDEDGVIHRERIPTGEYEVHFASIENAAWSEAAVEYDASAPPPVLDLKFDTEAVRAGTTVELEIHARGLELSDAPVFETSFPLATDDGKVLDKQTSRVRWALEGMPELVPGESLSLVFTVRIPGGAAVSGPLVVSWPAVAAEHPTEPDPTYITFDARDALGGAATRGALLKHPDGTIEEVVLDGGVLHRENVASGDYQLVFPHIVSAAWGKSSLELSDAPASVDMIVRHVGYAGGLFDLEVHVQGLEHSDVAVYETQWIMTADASKRLDEQETVARWKLEGLADLAPGESSTLTFAVVHGTDRLISGPLTVSRPEAKVDEPVAGEPNYITFDARDALGGGAARTALLQHPDGTVEEVELDQGVFHRENIASGDYKLVFPHLVSATWGADAIELGGDADGVDMVVRHVGHVDGELDLEVHVQGLEHSGLSLCSKAQSLAADPANRTGEQETRLRWALDGAPDLVPGESCALTFTAVLGTDRLVLGPLVVSRAGAPPPADEPAPEPKFVTFDLRDALGGAVGGVVLLKHPDGTLEEATLDEGVLHREGVAPGDYTLVVPHVVSAAWSASSLELGDDAASVDLVVTHVGYASGALAVDVHVAGLETSGMAVFEASIDLAVEADKRAEEAKTTITWQLDGLPDLLPGEHLQLVFFATVGRSRARSDVLVIHRPAAAPEDGAQSVENETETDA